MKSKALKRFYIFIWSIIFVACLILLVENIRFIYQETSVKSTPLNITNSLVDNDLEELQGEFVDNPNIPKDHEREGHSQDARFSSIHSDIPILNYTNDEISRKSNNIIIDSFAKSFPINQYVADSTINNNNSVMRNKGTISDVIGILDNIRNDQTILGGSVENVDNGNELEVGIIEGGVKQLEGEESPKNIESKEVLGSINGEYFALDQLLNRPFLYNNFYIIDSSTAVTDNLFDPNILVGKDLTMAKKPSNPQILIYHTHSQETYSDSRSGVEEDTVVGVGARLAGILSDYGYKVIHDKTKYDIMGDGLDRNLAYNYANDGVSKILEANPTIEVVIDIHRDAGNKRVTTINGVETAQVMLFNGICTNAQGQSVDSLPNPNLQGNLAFSLQLQLKSREAYPSFMLKNYLKALRYNLHHRERSMLAEVGTESNTVQEAKNAMSYLGALVNEVLSQ